MKMSEETNFDDYNASQITPQYTLLEKFNKIIDWLKGTKKGGETGGVKLYKHLITTNSLSIKYIQFVSTEKLGDFTVDSVINALKKMVGFGKAYCDYNEYAGYTGTTIFLDLPSNSSVAVDGIWGLSDGVYTPYNIVNLIRQSTIMTHSIVEVE